jgi:hypothetical protein
VADGAPPLPWTQPGWHDAVTAWIGEQAGRHGLSVTGPVGQPRIRAWSTVLPVPTNTGTLFFKATAPLTRHEVPLVAALARWCPQYVPRLLAVDEQRGWLLMADAGTSLRASIQSDGDWLCWRGVLQTYADLQIEVAPHAQDLLAFGVPDCRPLALTAAFERLLANEDALRIGRPDGLTREQYARLTRLTPLLAERCERLDRYGIPVAMDHSDFHDGNVFMDGDRPVFIDWGDACVGHPFCSLLVTFRSIAHALGIDERAPELAELEEVYLRPWQRFASPDALREAVARARWPAMLIRALSWQRALAPLSGPERDEYGDAVPAWLGDFLAAADT